MIQRVWKGWTAPENAEGYRNLLQNEVFPAIRQQAGEGYRGIRLLRREMEAEVEFCTIMTFDSLADVKEFVGAEDYETAHVPDRARALLKRFDPTSAHYTVVDTLSY